MRTFSLYLVNNTRQLGTSIYNINKKEVRNWQFLATFVEKGVGLLVEPTARNLLGSVTVVMITVAVVCLIYVLFKYWCGL